DLHLSDLQVINEERLLRSARLEPGQKCLIVGYPYGFSAFGPNQPTPIVLTRFVAGSNRIAGRHQQILLESIGAPGMSGGPVFVEQEDRLLLAGIYSGSICPHFPAPRGDRVTDLGTMSNLTAVFSGDLRLVRTPSNAAVRLKD